MEIDQETYTKITEVLLNLIPMMIASGLFYTLIKTFISNLKDYIMLRWDSLGVGSRVLYKGEECIIQQISFRKLTVLSDNKILLIPSTEWTKMAVILEHVPPPIIKHE